MVQVKLDNSCIRDILMFLEEECTPSAFVTYGQVYSALEDTGYTKEKLLGHILLLRDAGFIESKSRFGVDDGFIQSITWNGQQYITDIKNADVWNVLKEQVSDFSLDVLATLAKDVALGMAQKKLKDLGVLKG